MVTSPTIPLGNAVSPGLPNRGRCCYPWIIRAVRYLFEGCRCYFGAFCSGVGSYHSQKHKGRASLPGPLSNRPSPGTIQCTTVPRRLGHQGGLCAQLGRYVFPHAITYLFVVTSVTLYSVGHHTWLQLFSLIDYLPSRRRGFRSRDHHIQ